VTDDFASTADSTTNSAGAAAVTLSGRVPESAKRNCRTSKHRRARLQDRQHDILSPEPEEKKGEDKRKKVKGKTRKKGKGGIGEEKRHANWKGKGETGQN